MAIRHVVSVSGGKDSTATLLLALDRFPREVVVPIFCDTGNEHQAVYDYLDYLEIALEIKIHRLKADFSEQIAAKRMFIARDQRTRRDEAGRRVRWTNKAKRRALAVLHPTGNPYIDLCLWKGCFPYRKAQFCTEQLKRDPAVEFQLALVDQGYTVISWQGVRRDESQARRNAKLIERIGPKIRAYRPLVKWKAAQVFAYAESRGVQHNPLYRQGMGRVGCMPCINAQKGELREIASRFPDHVQKVSDWEWLVGESSKRGFSTFFTDGHEAIDRRQVFADLNIWSRIEWSRTTRGGRQFDLLADIDGPDACASAYGLCDKGEGLVTTIERARATEGASNG